ncbi:hypothetical protein RF11_04333 [Thelohanellus kitauei]|uniref:Uncharacterized protein n=1 Tax=Thelohanellus kitauei TaxID=669202 RepID=A0A0C2JNE8_THEKT|nr:hypothetical protein RF11_04333 [Thelohanellus kitauei]
MLTAEFLENDDYLKKVAVSYTVKSFTTPSFGLNYFGEPNFKDLLTVKFGAIPYSKNYKVVVNIKYKDQNHASPLSRDPQANSFDKNLTTSIKIKDYLKTKDLVNSFAILKKDLILLRM